MKHKHHIVPLHLGGTNDPSNIVSIDSHCHVTWHWCEWQRTGSVSHMRAYLFLKTGQPGVFDPPLIRKHKLTTRMKKFYGSWYMNYWLQYKSIQDMLEEYKVHKKICYYGVDILDSVFSIPSEKPDPGWWRQY